MGEQSRAVEGLVLMRPTMQHQRGLWNFNGHLFVPNGIDGSGSPGLGSPWVTDTAAKGITVSHPAPSAGFADQLKRTLYTQSAPGGAANNDQELGPRQNLASEYQYWTGNERFCGGWYMSVIFRVNAWDDDTGRLFIGLSESANPVVASDTMPNNSCGLWHSGLMTQDVLKFYAKNNAGTEAIQDVTTHALNPGILAAGVTLQWEMWHYPNTHDNRSASNVGVNFMLSLYDISNQTETISPFLVIPFNRIKRVKWQEQGNALTTNKFMAPQAQMSNGATDVTAGHFGIAIINIYCVPWSGEMT